MYRLLFILLRSLAAWPVLLLLIISISGLFWLASGLGVREQQVAEMLQKSFQLKKELAAKSEALNGLALVDLRRRVSEYSQDLLVADEALGERLKNTAEAAYATVRWELGEVEVMQEHVEVDASLGSIRAVFRASMPLEVGELRRLEYSQRLPGMAALRLSQLLWSAPPYEEFESLRIERTEGVFELELGSYFLTWSSPDEDDEGREDSDG
ncbi:MAG: hypothetical protein ACN4GF_02180 [Lentimonas sp.]